jgi:phospholipase C
VIVIMQENRSFDSYFGTYPGADGIPAAARAGTLPAVSWITPADAVSEHGPNSIAVGQDYVTGLGYIDHQVLSFDAYLKFIEDDFLGGQRLDPATDGRADPRPDVREDAPVLGDLTADFDFTQTPRPPLLLPQQPVPPIVPLAKGEYVSGAVTALGLGSLTMQVTVTGQLDTNEMGQVLTFAVTPKTIVQVNGAAGQLSSLKVGDAVAAYFNGTTGQANLLSALDP